MSQCNNTMEFFGVMLHYLSTKEPIGIGKSIVRVCYLIARSYDEHHDTPVGKNYKEIAERFNVSLATAHKLFSALLRGKILVRDKDGMICINHRYKEEIDKEEIAQTQEESK